MKKALLLIDVQNDFVSWRDRFYISYINKLINRYAEKKIPILSLVYDDPFGRTIVNSVKKNLKKVNKVWHFSKLQTNGAKETHSILLMRGLKPGKSVIEVCGFETDCCVLQTVSGLHKAGYKIVVHDSGTGANSIQARHSGINRMKKMGIEIINENHSVDRKKLDQL